MSLDINAKNESLTESWSLRMLIDKAISDLNNDSFDFSAQFEGDEGDNFSC